MSNGKTASSPQAKEQTVVEALTDSVRGNNDQLRGLLDDLRGFAARTTGQNLAAPPEASDRVDPAGTLSILRSMLEDQARTINDLRDTVLAIEKIG